MHGSEKFSYNDAFASHLEDMCVSGLSSLGCAHVQRL